MKPRALRLLSLLAVALLIPACNFSFTTSDPGAPVPPNPFMVQVPYDGQAGVWPTNTQFAWGAYPGATSYTLELSLDSSFSQILHTRSGISISSVFLQVNLTHSTTYYWRVSTVVGGLTVYAAGSPSRFTTLIAIFGPPVQFFLQSPLGTTVGAVPAPVFSWTYAQEATSYSFQIDTTDKFLSPVVDLPDLRLTQVTCPVVLTPSKTYYWRVNASNSGGTTASTPLFSTVTIGP